MNPADAVPVGYARVLGRYGVLNWLLFGWAWMLQSISCIELAQGHGRILQHSFTLQPLYFVALVFSHEAASATEFSRCSNTPGWADEQLDGESILQLVQHGPVRREPCRHLEPPHERADPARSSRRAPLRLSNTISVRQGERTVR